MAYRNRFDCLRIPLHFLNLDTEQDFRDLHDYWFQTKSLEREYLYYRVNKNGLLYYDDFNLEIVKDSSYPLGIYLKRNDLGAKLYREFSGDVVIHGKPYEKYYRFLLEFSNGRLISVQKF